MAALFCFVVQVLLASFLAAPPSRVLALEFSWSTLPVFFHSSVMNSLIFSDADLAIIARFPMVTIEKWQGCNSTGCYVAGAKETNCPTQEEATIATAKALKAINPNITIVAWYDSLRIYANKTLNPQAINNADQFCVRNAHTPFLETHPDYLLFNAKGARALEGYCHFNVYDHTKPLVRDYWRQACLNLTATGLIAGCGADASQQTGAYIIGLTTAVQQRWTAGHIQAVNATTQAVAAQGGLVLGKLVSQLGTVNGVLQEGCTAGNATITTLRAATAASARDGRSYVYECHSNGTPDDMAAFLVGAGAHHYWGFGQWYTPHGGYAGSWLPEFDRPLGPPLGNGVYDDATATWTRRFSSGTSVTFNAKTNKGAIAWGTLGDGV